MQQILAQSFWRWSIPFEFFRSEKTETTCLFVFFVYFFWLLFWGGGRLDGKKSSSSVVVVVQGDRTSPSMFYLCYEGGPSSGDRLHANSRLIVCLDKERTIGVLISKGDTTCFAQPPELGLPSYFCVHSESSSSGTLEVVPATSRMSKIRIKFVIPLSCRNRDCCFLSLRPEVWCARSLSGGASWRNRSERTKELGTKRPRSERAYFQARVRYLRLALAPCPEYMFKVSLVLELFVSEFAHPDARFAR